MKVSALGFNIVLYDSVVDSFPFWLKSICFIDYLLITNAEHSFSSLQGLKHITMVTSLRITNEMNFFFPLLGRNLIENSSELAFFFFFVFKDK